jgi:hypothetical protein
VAALPAGSRGIDREAQRGGAWDSPTDGSKAGVDFGTAIS